MAAENLPPFLISQDYKGLMMMQYEELESIAEQWVRPINRKDLPCDFFLAVI